MSTVMKSLKQKLVILFLLVALVPLLLCGILNYFEARNALKNEAFNKLKSVALSRQHHIIDYIQNQLKIVSVMSKDDTFKDLKNVTDIKRNLEELITDMPEIYELFVLNRSGRIIMSTDEKNVGLDRSKDEYFAQSITGKELVKDIYKSTLTGLIGYTLSVPIRGVNGSDISGVLVARGKVSNLNNITAIGAGLGETGEVYLVDKDKYIITASRILGDDIILKTKADTHAVNKAFSEKEYLGFNKDYRNQDVLAFCTTANFEKELGLNWCLVAEIDKAEAFAPITTIRNILILLLLIISAVVAWIAFVMAKSIATPILNISNTAKNVANGDLSVSLIEVNSNDEVKTLADSFSTMLRNLSEIVAKIKTSVNDITSASSEILAASQQEASAAREQSSAISETTAAANELSKSAEMVGENIKRVSQVTSHTLSGMAKIRESIDKTGKLINSLNEKSQKIGKITEVIDDVADQTNLLAVNAAIEAARAGEHGAGFTVVADEIRKLSDSTARSTKDITDLIEIIQHEISNALVSMEQSTVNVEEEVKLAQESAEKAKEISMNASQQVGGSKQIAEAMLSINEAMKQIVSGAQQAQVAAKQLNSLGQELKDITMKFKTRE